MDSNLPNLHYCSIRGVHEQQPDSDPADPKGPLNDMNRLIKTRSRANHFHFDPDGRRELQRLDHFVAHPCHNDLLLSREYFYLLIAATLKLAFYLEVVLHELSIIILQLLLR